MIYFLPHWAIGTGVLGQTPPPKWKEGRKREKNAGRETAGSHEKSRVGANPASGPFSPVVCIEHPCSHMQGSVSSFFHLTYFPFRVLQKRRRLISVNTDDGISFGFAICHTKSFNRCCTPVWFPTSTIADYQLSSSQIARPLRHSPPANAKVSSMETCSPLVVFLGPGARSQMQITEPNRPNGPASGDLSLSQ